MDAAYWNERFAKPGHFYGEAPNVFVAEVARQIPAGPVLCLAEGKGRNAAHLATLGYRVTAVDQSEVGLDKARRLAGARGVEIETVVADLANYSAGADTWAGIVAIVAHLPPGIRHKVHAEAARGLRPGGILALKAYTPAQLKYGTGGPKSPELLMSLNVLREELAEMELLVDREIERDVIEGNGHTGCGAVVQILARRHE